MARSMMGRPQGELPAPITSAIAAAAQRRLATRATTTWIETTQDGNEEGIVGGVDAAASTDQRDGDAVPPWDGPKRRMVTRDRSS
jgi:hypothetical protein